jgi:UDP-N-acetyl-D-glucosamine dehydrogenase
MPEHVADRVADLLNEDRLAVNGAKVLVLGVAYKADVGDMRESPAIDVMNLLAQKGADISYHDPHVREFEVEGRVFKNVDLSEDTLAGTDLVVILTNHSAIDYEHLAAHAHRIFDTRNATADVVDNRERITKL